LTRKRTNKDEFDGFVKLGDVLKKQIRKLGLNKNVRLRRIDAMWEKATSREVADMTMVVSLKQGTLTVDVANSVLMAELTSFHKKDLLGKLRALAEEFVINDIRFRLKGK